MALLTGSRGIRNDDSRRRPPAARRSLSLPPCATSSLLVLLLGLVMIVDTAVAAATDGIAFLFPSAPGLVALSSDVLNVTFSLASPSNGEPAQLTLYDTAHPEREVARLVNQDEGWALFNLSALPPREPSTESEVKFRLETRSYPAHPGLIAESAPFLIMPSEADDETNSDLRRGLDSPLAPTPTLPSHPLLPRSATIPSPTSQHTTGPGSVPIQCPADNLTVFTEPTSGKRYVVQCDIDYHREEGTKEIGMYSTSTFNECLTLCAVMADCKGAGWGEYEGENKCWLKSVLGNSHPADTTWYFGIEDPTQPGTPVGSSTSSSTSSSSSSTSPAGAAAAEASAISASRSKELSPDAKAGIGVGVTVGAILVGLAGVMVWYRYQQKKLHLKKQDLLDKKLEAGSNATDAGSGASLFRKPELYAGSGPPTRGNSPSAHHELSNRGGDGYGGGYSGGDSSPHDPHLAHVAGHIHLQQARQAARQQQNERFAEKRYQQYQHPFRGDAKTHTPPPPPSAGFTLPPGSMQSNFASVSTPTSYGQQQQEWQRSAELPVREGYQGYGPEYEMSAGMPAPPRPYLPGGGGGREWEEQKFLLADMKGAKVTVRTGERYEMG